jgi:hypothetical protein
MDVSDRSDFSIYGHFIESVKWQYNIWVNNPTGPVKVWTEMGECEIPMVIRKHRKALISGIPIGITVGSQSGCGNDSDTTLG